MKIALVAMVTLLPAFGQPAPKKAAAAPAFIRELVVANHILANQGVLDAYGHVSIRDPKNPQHFWLARHMAAGTVTASDIIEYDLDSKPVSGDPSAGYTERFIHGEIYRARPDVMAIVHCHSPDLIPFGVSSTPLRPVYHMAGFLEVPVPIFEIRIAAGLTDMLIRTPELGHALAETLGSKPAALMRGHGAVVVAPSLHVVVGRAYYLNMNARLQAQAISLGGPVTYLDPVEAQKTGAQDGFERAWDYWKSQLK